MRITSALASLGQLAPSLLPDMVAAVDRWPPLQVATLEAKLDELIQLIRSDGDTVSDDARAWLARLLVIRSCGFIEQVVVEVQRGYVNAKSGGRVRAFAASWLERTHNPTPERLCT